MANRKAAMAEIIKFIEMMLPNSGNKELYEETLGKLSDEEFDSYMKKLETGEETLFLVLPNFSKPSLSVENNLKVAKELGHNFFERLYLTDHHTGVTYLTPIPYLVVDLPVRRQAQMLSKKISIPEDDEHVDDVLTGQPMGPSKGSKISFPELQVLYAQELNKTIEELIKFRGGDEEAFRVMNKRIIDTGMVNIDAIDTGTRVKSTETLKTLLMSMHLDSTL